MTKSELRAYAKKHGLTLSEAKEEIRKKAGGRASQSTEPSGSSFASIIEQAKAYTTPNNHPISINPAMFTPVLENEYVTIYEAVDIECDDDNMEEYEDQCDRYLEFFQQHMGGVTQQIQNLFSHICEISDKMVGGDSNWPSMQLWGFAHVKKDFSSSSGKIEKDTCIPMPFWDGHDEWNVVHGTYGNQTLRGLAKSFYHPILVYCLLANVPENTIDNPQWFMAFGRMKTPQTYATWYHILRWTYQEEMERLYNKNQDYSMWSELHRALD